MGLGRASELDRNRLAQIAEDVRKKVTGLREKTLTLALPVGELDTLLELLGEIEGVEEMTVLADKKHAAKLTRYADVREGGSAAARDS